MENWLCEPSAACLGKKQLKGFTLAAIWNGVSKRKRQSVSGGSWRWNILWKNVRLEISRRHRGAGQSSRSRSVGFGVHHSAFSKQRAAPAWMRSIDKASSSFSEPCQTEDAYSIVGRTYDLNSRMVTARGSWCDMRGRRPERWEAMLTRDCTCEDQFKSDVKVIQRWRWSPTMAIGCFSIVGVIACCRLLSIVVKIFVLEWPNWPCQMSAHSSVRVMASCSSKWDWQFGVFWCCWCSVVSSA